MIAERVLRRTLSVMDVPATHQLVAGGLGIAGVLVGYACALFAARRTVDQPLSQEPEAEAYVLAAVLNDPARHANVAVLEVADFAVTAHGRIWMALNTILAGLPGVVETGAAPTLVSILDNSDMALIATIVHSHPEAGEDSDALLAAGQKVMDASKDRGALGGTGLVAETAVGDALPLTRVWRAPSALRRLASAACGGIGMGGAAVVAPGTGVAWALGAGALITLVIMGIVVSLVDLDTFYIDLVTFVPGAVVAWVLTIAAAVVTGEPGRLIAGGAIVFAVAVLFEGSNRAYRLIRKSDGMGMGDTMLIFATAGVPAALTGSWELAFHGIMAGMLGGIVVWVLGAVAGKMTRETPFAFGPYLAAGWFVAWLYDGLLADGALGGTDVSTLISGLL